ncbi:unnamed protein product [Albugo candida]|uniref:Cwf19-like C-terminal domain-containing protein n=1 Tax=Albugo candida TaxID=65357 RepID=A0A024G0W4_9STRA|nr:unnamed protein product [Albugo candida]|eukprot:CCI40482.1 unnamed protein product [Albugo candida]
MQLKRSIHAPDEDYIHESLNDAHLYSCGREIVSKKIAVSDEIESVSAEATRQLKANKEADLTPSGDSQEGFQYRRMHSPPIQTDVSRHKSDAQEDMDINKIAACALRAQMLGDLDQFQLYKNKLGEREAELHESIASTGSISKHHSNSFSGFGQKSVRHGKKEQNQRTLANTESSLEDLVRQERISHAHNAICGVMKPHLSGVEQLVPFTAEKTARRIEQALILSKTGESQKERCWHCLQNPQFRNSELLSVGRCTYLITAHSSQRLAPQHCWIVPLHHLPSFAAADDQTWKEVQLYQQSLRAFFRRINKSVIFLEQTSAPHHRRHTKIECIPVVPAIASSASLYFRQELLQATEEWATHSKILEINGPEKGFRRIVPSRTPYFYVEWDNGKGYAHIIENESKFSRQFGLDVIKGMAESSEQDAAEEESTIDDSFDQNKEKSEFKSQWPSFDWTTQLDE